MTSARGSSVDSFDRSILDIMQKSNRATSEQIAEKVGLSPAAVQRRIKRMREQKIIQADVSVVDPKAVGRNMTFVVEVSVERERADLMDMFKRDMLNHNAVQQCYYVTGSTDFILLVTAFDMESFDLFTRETFFNNSNIRSFQTHVVMDAVKVGLAMPVDEKPE